MAGREGLTLAGFLLSLVALGAPALADERPAETRVDLYDRSSARTGSAIVNERTGRVDVYDRRSNRVGYGTIDRKSGRVDTFDTRSRRTGSGTLSGSKGGKK